jgi:hypothetical protein
VLFVGGCDYCSGVVDCCCSDGRIGAFPVDVLLVVTLLTFIIVILPLLCVVVDTGLIVLLLLLLLLVGIVMVLDR